MTFGRFSADERAEEVEQIKKWFLDGAISAEVAINRLLSLGYNERSATAEVTEWDLPDEIA